MSSYAQNETFMDADDSFGVLSYEASGGSAVLQESEASSSSGSTGVPLDHGLRNRRTGREPVTTETSNADEMASCLRQEEEITETGTSQEGAESGECEIVSVSDEEASEVFDRCSEILSEDEKDNETRVSFKASDITEASTEEQFTKETDEKPQRREVYRMPEVKGVNQDSVIFWPANMIILAVAWQVKGILYVCSTIVSLLMFLYGLVVDPVQKTADVKKQITEQLNLQVKPVVTDLGPKVTGFAKRFGWGILAVTYVGMVLSFLVVPVLLVEYFYVTKYIEQPLDIKAPLYFNYTEAHPSATVPLAPYLGTTDGTKTFSWYKLYADVTLTLPESDHNQNLGMFQVAAEVRSVEDEVLETSSRPCMLRFQSSPIRYARTLIYSVPVLLDVTGEYQLLHLDILELLQHSSVSIGSIRVILQPRAGFPPGAGLPELYASEIRIRSQLPWTKSLAYKWKRTIYVWTATVLFIGEVGVILCCFRQVLLPRRRKSHQQYHPATPVRKVRNAGKKRVSFQETS